MTREEAINVVKSNWLDSSYKRLREALKTLIPELKESEDERIRKEMLAFCERASSGQVTIMVDKDTEDFKSWISWLKKQDAQTIKEALRTEYEKGRADAIAEFEKQCERRPIEWNADDLLKRNQIMDILQEYNRTELITWFEKQCKQKPAEWSEEDNALIKNIYTALKGYALHERKVDLDEHAHRLEEMAEKLKSLKPQPHWKPSELDIHLLERIANGKSDPQYFQISLGGLIRRLKKLKGE